MVFGVESMKNNYKIAVIDYGMSNMFSIQNALNVSGFESEITSDYSTIMSSDGAVLPGVGSFPEAMKNIKNLGLDESISEFIATGKQFMGICLGLQLLFDESNEIDNTRGLEIIPGSVKHFSNTKLMVKVPHVGWNCIKKNKILGNEDIINPLKNSNDGEFFYFVHSFYAEPEKSNHIYTTTEYGGIEFCSSILHENIFACQFHPEKSGKKGILILRDFFNK